MNLMINYLYRYPLTRQSKAEPNSMFFVYYWLLHSSFSNLYLNIHLINFKMLKSSPESSTSAEISQYAIITGIMSAYYNVTKTYRYFSISSLV